MKSTEKGNFNLLFLTGMVAFLLLIAAGFLLYARHYAREDGPGHIRSVERTELYDKVMAEQSEILSSLDWERAFTEEVSLRKSETPGPVQDSVQRARPVPLTR